MLYDDVCIRTCTYKLRSVSYTHLDVYKRQEFRKIRKDIENKTKNVRCKKITVSSSAIGDMSTLSGGGLSVNVYGENQQKLIKISEDVVKMMKNISGVKTATNGIETADKMLHLKINRNKAAEHGLTIAQIYQEIAKHTTTEKNAITLNMDDKDVEVKMCIRDRTTSASPNAFSHS